MTPAAALPCCFFFLVTAGASGQGFPTPGSGGGDPLGGVTALENAEYTDCEPTAPQIAFEHGYTVSMCIEYLDKGVGPIVKADARDYGLDSRESGLLYFFDRDNAEVLIKVLDACHVNGHYWVFVAPVTTLAFNLYVDETATGKRWTHRNPKGGRTAATKSDVTAFPCDRAAPPPRDVPPPPPPLGADPPNLSALADAFRTREFAHNAGLGEMNAHWAYARGVTGEGETIAMTDTGLYAAHVDLRGQLHGETVYTVISDDANGDGWEDYDYHKVADRAPETAYPLVTRETGEPCASTGRQCRKFVAYGHGTQMAALAVGARGSGTAHLPWAAHGLAFNARLRFLPVQRHGTFPQVSWGGCWYHFPGELSPNAICRHDLVRDLGNAAPVVSNAWLTGRSDFVLPEGLPWSDYRPFHLALGPNYAGYQSDRPLGERAVLVWSACNIPSTDGPKCGEAALPSISERQLRAATGGGTGLADVLLTDEQRRGLSAAEALRRAEAIVADWRKHWLAVTSVFDADFSRDRAADCALMDSLRRRGAAECAIDYTMRETSRCGFASDWCVAAGSAWANLVLAAGGHVPDPEQGYALLEYKSSPASAAASAAYALLLEAYRGADGALTVGTHKVLERLKRTANAGIFDYHAAHSPDGRSIVQLEEEQIRALAGIAGATDDELRGLVRDARTDFAGLLPEIPREDLTREETGGAFTPEERSLIAAAKAGLSGAQWDRFHLLSRVSDHFSGDWRRVDTFPPQLGRVKKLLDETGPNDHPDGARANDLLARLIRQVEWIDEQLRRIGRTKDSVTDAEIRRITVTSMIGHGLIDLKAATDPAR